MSQHRRHQREHAGGQHGRRVAEISTRPEPHHESRHHEEGQDAEPHARQHPLGMAVAIHHRHAFLILILDSHGPRARQIRSQRGHHTGQRRMLRFVAVHVLRQVLQAARHVTRFVPRRTHFRISGRRCAGRRAQSGRRPESSERRVRNGIRVASQNAGDAAPGVSAAGRSGGFVFFLDMRNHFLPSRLPGARYMRSMVPTRSLHRKIGVPGPYVGIAVFQAVLRGVIERGTHRGPTFGGMQRMDVRDRRQAGIGLQKSVVGRVHVSVVDRGGSQLLEARGQAFGVLPPIVVGIAEHAVGLARAPVR